MRKYAAWPLTALLAVFLAGSPLVAQDETALDRYVHQANPPFQWQPMGRSFPGLGYTSFNLWLRSQQWRAFDEVKPRFWDHWLRVIVPAGIPSRTAVLLVNGGSIDDPNPGAASLQLGLASAATGIVIAELMGVPNEPLQFTGEAEPRSEDAILAHGMDLFLRTGDETWPPQLPMVKAVVAAMDTVAAFGKDLRSGGNADINSFIVGGASKRGWASWLTAAADKRVVGIVPFVFDALNLQESLKHHWQAYGAWSSAIHDYEKEGIFAWFHSRQMNSLMRIIDPFQYRDRLTMPKYLINAAGDEFFVPTSSQFYFDDLEGPKYLRYIPNASHSLEGADTDALGGALVWSQAVILGQALPQFDWVMPDDGRIILRSQTPPATVKLWQATNPQARDFRVETIGKSWTSTTVAPEADGSYVASVAAPPAGWTAFFLEMTYPSSGSLPFTFTTPLRVIPKVLPFAPPLVSVLAASGDPRAAPDSIASVYGQSLSESTAQATELPLTRELAGSQVRIWDGNRVLHVAPLFFVSPTQINYLLPGGVVPGLGQIEVWRGSDRISVGQMLIEPVAPGLFSANGDGKGVAAAVAQRTRSGETIGSDIIFDATAPEGSRKAVPVRLASSQQIYLLLFGTGMRQASEATATVGGVPVDVLGPAPSSQFEGLDQVNLGPLPNSLMRAGEVNIELVVDGIPANIVTVTVE